MGRARASQPVPGLVLEVQVPPKMSVRAQIIKNVPNRIQNRWFGLKICPEACQDRSGAFLTGAAAKKNKKSPAFLFFVRKKKVWAGPGPPGQSLAWSQGLPARPWPGQSPAQNVGSGPNHQKWPESGPESTVWPETWSRSMPGPFRSLWDGSNPLQGAVPGKKSKKVWPSRPRLLRLCVAQWLGLAQGTVPLIDLYPPTPSGVTRRVGCILPSCCATLEIPP